MKRRESTTLGKDFETMASRVTQEFLRQIANKDISRLSCEDVSSAIRNRILLVSEDDDVIHHPLFPERVEVVVERKGKKPVKKWVVPEPDETTIDASNLASLVTYGLRKAGIRIPNAGDLTKHTDRIEEVAVSAIRILLKGQHDKTLDVDEDLEEKIDIFREQLQTCALLHLAGEPVAKHVNAVRESHNAKDSSSRQRPKPTMDPADTDGEEGALDEHEIPEEDPDEEYTEGANDMLFGHDRDSIS